MHAAKRAQSATERGRVRAYHRIDPLLASRATSAGVASTSGHFSGDTPVRITMARNTVRQTSAPMASTCASKRKDKWAPHRTPALQEESEPGNVRIPGCWIHLTL